MRSERASECAREFNQRELCSVAIKSTIVLSCPAPHCDLLPPSPIDAHPPPFRAETATTRRRLNRRSGPAVRPSVRRFEVVTRCLSLRTRAPAAAVYKQRPEEHGAARTGAIYIAQYRYFLPARSTLNAVRPPACFHDRRVYIPVFNLPPPRRRRRRYKICRLQSALKLLEQLSINHCSFRRVLRSFTLAQLRTIET